jgi:hypothetical protein
MSVQHLADTINLWVEHWNTDPAPFRRIARPEDTLTKIERARTALTDTQTNSVSDHKPPILQASSTPPGFFRSHLSTSPTAALRSMAQ